MAVLHLSRILAVELGPHGITSNVVHPGVTSTERSDAMLAERAEREGISVEEAERRTPTGNDLDRRIAAREVADLVAFLASPRASAVTGETIGAGGGARPALFI